MMSGLSAKTSESQKASALNQTFSKCSSDKWATISDGNLEKQKSQGWDFPGGPVVTNLPQNAGDVH